MITESHKDIRVLIVDDSSFMRKVLETILASDESVHVVGHAKDGREAVRLAESLKPDVITMDINMPIMDGLEFVKQLAGVSNAKGVPVVMITTEGSESHVVQALSSGARGYIRKPFTADQVKEHVLPVLAVKT